MRDIATKSVIKKDVSTKKVDLLKFHFIFCFYYPIFLNNVFHYVIYMVNNDHIFTLNPVNVNKF